MTCHSPPTNLGILEDVDVRSAWPHEASCFTPWLAANIDRLADALGISLEVTGTEVSVPPFSADIIAVRPEDGSRVLIENQLERSDHTHLGQVLTYLAGLEALTVVWIAAQFTDPHLSAIRWLNQNTVEPLAFFAVQVRAVRIGDSAIAPLFDVLERPNDWDRVVHKASSKVESERNAFWREFWEHFVALHPDEGGRAAALSWRQVEVPGTPLVVVKFVAKDAVGVFVRGGRGVPPADTAELLEPRSKEMEERVGVPMGTRPPYFFERRFKIDTRDRANWDRMADWLHDESARYVTAVSSIYGENADGPGA